MALNVALDFFFFISHFLSLLGEVSKKSSARDTFTEIQPKNPGRTFLYPLLQTYLIPKHLFKKLLDSKHTFLSIYLHIIPKLALVICYESILLKIHLLEEVIIHFVIQFSIIKNFVCKITAY